MKKLIFLLCCLAANISLFGQATPKYSTYYYQRATLFEQLPVSADDILFVGNSITDGGEWSELFNNPHVKTGESAEIPPKVFTTDFRCCSRGSPHRYSYLSESTTCREESRRTI